MRLFRNKVDTLVDVRLRDFVVRECRSPQSNPVFAAAVSRIPSQPTTAGVVLGDTDCGKDFRLNTAYFEATAKGGTGILPVQHRLEAWATQSESKQLGTGKAILSL